MMGKFIIGLALASVFTVTALLTTVRVDLRTLGDLRCVGLCPDCGGCEQDCADQNTSDDRGD